MLLDKHDTSLLLPTDKNKDGMSYIDCEDVVILLVLERSSSSSNRHTLAHTDSKVTAGEET